MSRGIVVLGMHRSGTSCTAEVLAAMGAYFGSVEMATGGTIQNPHGLFERKDLRHLCHFILQQARAEWWCTSRFSAERLPAEARAAIDHMLAPILADLDAHEAWFVKEPRLCLLLPMLRDFFGDIVGVCVWRDPLEVAESLRTRDAMPIEFGAALWERYVRASFAAGVPNAIVSYNRLTAEPEGTTRKLLEDLTALGIAGLRMPTAEQLASAVDPALRRSRPRQSVTDILTPSQRRLLVALESGNSTDPELSRPLSFEQIAAVERFEQARRLQMKEAAYRSLVEARSSRPSSSRIGEIVSALRYVPWNPLQWLRWYRHGTLRRQLAQHADAFGIAFNGGFDRNWYARRYPDVPAETDPLMHFVRWGASEGRDPSPSCPTARHLHAVLDTTAQPQ